MGTNSVKHRMFPVNNQRHFFTVRDQALMGGDCQEKLWCLCPWRCWDSVWTCGHCPGQSLGSQDDLYTSLPTIAFLWFCKQSVVNMAVTLVRNMPFQLQFFLKNQILKGQTECWYSSPPSHLHCVLKERLLVLSWILINVLSHQPLVLIKAELQSCFSLKSLCSKNKKIPKPFKFNFPVVTTIN